MIKLIRILSWSLLTVALLISCQNNPNNATAETSASKAPAVEGYWVNKAWWETLQSTKSPHQAAEKLGIAAVVVKKDSTGAWEAVVNYAFHEGMNYKLQPAEGGNFTLLTIEENKAYHDFKFNADNTVFLDSFQMIRIGDSKMGDASLSASILSGTYALKGGGEVTFAPNGTLSGIPGYDRYEVLFDYIEDQLRSDEIMLLKTNTEFDRDFYVFEQKGNLLLFSEIEEQTLKDGGIVYLKGKVKYELTKK